MCLKVWKAQSAAELSSLDIGHNHDNECADTQTTMLFDALTDSGDQSYELYNYSWFRHFGNQTEHD